MRTAPPTWYLEEAGGVGKTRPALREAESVLDAYPNGVWQVELASVADPGLVSLAAWFDRLDADHDNLRTTLRWPLLGTSRITPSSDPSQIRTTPAVFSDGAADRRA